MMIKVGDEYLDYDGDIIIEKQAKLFENISSNNGDYSYQFDLPNTSKNNSILDVEINIVNKNIYTSAKADILTDTGILVYSGFIKVENKNANIIKASFFSGNTNWIARVASRFEDINFDNYNVKFSDTLSSPSISNITEGIIFPFIDAGLLEARNAQGLIYDDFVPWIFVKTVVKEIFKNAGIKISGDILNDPIYNRMIITNGRNEWYQQFIDDRTISVGKSATQYLTSQETVTFTDDNYPKFIGGNNNYSTVTNQYTADVDMYVTVECFLSTDDLATGTGSGLYRNGINITDDYRPGASTVGTDYTFKYESIHLLAGDTLEMKMEPLSDINIFDNSYFKITPFKFDTVYANSILPESPVEFLDNVFKIFNTVIDFDPFSSTVSLNLFKYISKKSEQDLSKYYSSLIDIQYYEMIDEYGKINTLRYSNDSTNQVNDYNNRNAIPFGGGNINVNNNYIKQEIDLINSPLVLGINYDNPQFNNIMKTELLEASSIKEYDITVTALGILALFTTSIPHDIAVGDLIELSELEFYEGQGVVVTVTATEFILFRYFYKDNDSGKASRMKITINSTDTYIALTNKVSTTDMGFNDYHIITPSSSLQFTQLNYAWAVKKLIGFNLDNIIGSLSFGDITLDFYENRLNIIDNYFKEFVHILQDPIKVIVEMHIPEHVFKNITFYRPVRLRSIDVNALFYLNKITGYINSYTPCTLELIKLSV